MPKRPIQATDLNDFHLVSDPQISNDGSQILFTKGKVGSKCRVVTNLFLVDAKSGAVKQLTQGDGGNGQGRWSPDNRTVAFISGREKPASQIFTIPMDGGEAACRSKLPEGSIGAIKWSPDGKQIAFTFRETEASRTSDKVKARQESGESNPPWEIDTLWYRLDGDGYFGNQRYKLYVLDLASGEHTMIYDADALGSYSFDWMPNSQELLVCRNAGKDPLIEKPNNQFYIVPLKGKPKAIKGLPVGQKFSVAVSPDGKRVAYLGDVGQDDPWGVRNDKLYVAKIDGSEVSCLSDGDDYCLAVASLSDTGAGGDSVCQWLGDNKTIRVMVGYHGESQVAECQVGKNKVSILTKGKHVLGVGTSTLDGKRTAVTIGTPTQLAEIGIVEGGKVKTLTSFNKEFHENVEAVAPEEIWVDSTDGVKVQAWVLRPAGKKTYPAILEVHGGPHTQYGWAYFHEFQLLVAQGYAVVYSNPRGSKGYGEAFCAAIRGDWGNKDWDDVQAVTKWMQAQPAIKTGQIGIMGGSYGGYMTNWAISHSKDYRAAITDRCVSNWLSASGNSDFPLNRDGYFGGYAWGDLESIAKLWQQSPISHFEGVSTPTLVIHSEGDLRCNVEQSEQVFFALKSQGVESRFVRYPTNTSHGMSRNGPADMKIHRLGEIVAWWKKYFS